MVSENKPNPNYSDHNEGVKSFIYHTNESSQNSLWCWNNTTQDGQN